MKKLSGPNRRDYQRQRAIENDLDRERRAERLSENVVTHWTKVILKLSPTITAGVRPCSYEPWQQALDDRSGPLMSIAKDIAQPRWPEPRADLIEFALVFLEADVMLFGSGYTKRHLIKRLQQSPLSKDDILRIDKLLRRAVSDGTGLEEFSAYKRLAAHLVVSGELPDLSAWLSERAIGVGLTLNKADGSIFQLVPEKLNVDDPDYKLWLKGFFRPSKWGSPHPELTPAVLAGKRVKETEQQIKYNAFQILHAIRLRQQSERRKN